MIKNIIALLSIVAIAGIGYFLFIERNGSALDLVTAQNISTQLLTNTQVFIERRTTLDRIRFDFAVLDDERFTSLRSYASPVIPVPVGKQNLFDIGAAGVVTTSQ